MKSPETEKVIEAYFVKEVERLGGIAYKFSSPNRRFVPDRICAFPTGLCTFVEIKGPKGITHSGQVRELKRLWELGFLTTILKSRGDVDLYVEGIKTTIKWRYDEDAKNSGRDIPDSRA